MRVQFALALALGITPTVDAQELRSEELADGRRAEWQESLNADGETLRQGSYALHHASGGLEIRGSFERGQRQSKWEWFWPDGTERAEGTYRDGKLHGAFTLRGEDGRPVATGKLDRGRLSGRWRFGARKGPARDQHSGSYVWIARPLGTVSAWGYRCDGLPHGPWSLQHTEGPERIDVSFRRGNPVGVWALVHSDRSAEELHSGEPPMDPQLVELLRFLAEPLPDQPVPAPHDESPLERGDTLPVLLAPGTTEEQRTLLSALVRSLQTDDRGQQDRAQTELLAHGRRAVPFLLEELERMDLGQLGQASWAAWYSSFLARLTHRTAPSWQEATDHDAQAANARVVLSWRLFWALGRGVERLWSFDLRMPSTGRGLHELVAHAVVAELCAEAPLPPPDYSRRRGDHHRIKASVDAALDWLAAHQGPDGAWGRSSLAERCAELPGEKGPCTGDGHESHDVGVTGLATLAFLGAGHTLESKSLGDVLRKSVGWLVSQQDRAGRLTGSRPNRDFLYSHLIAGVALCQAQKASPSPGLRLAVERAVDFTLRARNPSGAWRYDVPANGENDTSITGWAIRMLVAAQGLGIDVPAEALASGIEWIDTVSDLDGHVGYDGLATPSARTMANRIFPPDLGDAMTATGLLIRQLLGQTPREAMLHDERIMELHAARLLARPPEWNVEGYGTDMYYWLHGSDAMVRAGTDEWKAWSQALHDALLPNQVLEGHAAGSWDPVGPWGYVGGRIYSTAISALALEAERRADL